MAALLAHPDRIELLLARPEFVPSAVEEILRWASPPWELPGDLPEEVPIGPAENAA